jgi:hypothetical protein
MVLVCVYFVEAFARTSRKFGLIFPYWFTVRCIGNLFSDPYRTSTRSSGSAALGIITSCSFASGASISAEEFLNQFTYPKMRASESYPKDMENCVNCPWTNLLQSPRGVWWEQPLHPPQGQVSVSPEQGGASSEDCWGLGYSGRNIYYSHLSISLSCI